MYEKLTLERCPSCNEYRDFCNCSHEIPESYSPEDYVRAVVHFDSGFRVVVNLRH